MQAHNLSTLGLFSPTKQTACFADNLVNLDHTLDQKLLELYEYIDIQKSLDKRSNPKPDDEIEYFYLQSKSGRSEMLIRNLLLLSRLFIRHAKLMKLPDYFSEKKQINILDLGCGNAPDLLGILALFGIERIQYFGVEKYDKCFDECVGVYEKLMEMVDITFVQQDARNFLVRDEFKNYFDLVLIQHPNFQSEPFQPIFAEIFKKACNVISPGGILYSTFYMQKEADYFIKEVLPSMPVMQGYELVKSDSYQEEAKINVDEEMAGSENYIFMSPPMNLHLSNRPKL